MMLLPGYILWVLNYDRNIKFTALAGSYLFSIVLNINLCLSIKDLQ
ncbi:hypothetical protein HMPREF0201_00881 [Cedecea davisae DSM 4568]|uniref:Uncharacterized protein n=1 Tax=Cedecea davisae DSM 4568 TaxID=566551 RepID=S3JG46_9ENTR|nr:hypothetical protein HMPREF0201_00881 [Cedecea davisae DSM 4568]